MTHSSSDALASRRERAIAERVRRAAGGLRLVPAAPAIARDGDLSWARALDLPCPVDPCSLVGKTTLSGDDTAAKIRTDLGIIKPRLGGELVVLSTGAVGAGLGGLLTPEPGTDFGLGGAEDDAATLQLELNVPANATRLSFQYNFLSTESPEFVNTIFNDTFAVQVIDDAGPHDFTVATVNDAHFFEASDSHAKGTGFDLYANDTFGVTTVFGGVFPDAGLTDFQVFSVEVTPGSKITLTFSIQDNGDGILDSAVVLDALQFSSIDTVDPDPGLLAAGAVTQDPEALAIGGRVVRGAVADGASQIVLRVKTPGPGSVKFAVPPPADATTLVNGSLTAIDGSGPIDPA
ncbi:MAG TPA: choice-of-anchor L domain-containing protein, partial [Kofleriaceae bacterium]|nr:choice-of-anchor L domain-containing protein [Kofleriaceae bacterium]